MVISRRTFLGAAAAGTATVLASPLRARAQTAGGVFQHGVASGDPLADRVIIWTRVTPSADATPGSARGPAVVVAWEVASDRDFKAVVGRGQATATVATDHTVKVDVTGLRPGADHWYRFRALGVASPVGRTRTAPRAGTAVDALRLGVVTCAEYEFGYFGAYRHLAGRDDVDAVLHLGDYIYEFGVGYGAPPTSLPTPGAALGRTHQPPHEIVSLADYRTRYGQYRRDRDAQLLHAAHPMIVMYDDHEIANDSWRDGAQNHGADEGPFAARAEAARRAWREWMPIRQVAPDPGVVHRSFRFGDLVELWMLDERRYRDEQPMSAFVGYGAVDPAIEDPSRSMLGAAQREWLLGGLHSSNAAWKVLGNPVQFFPIEIGPALLAALGTALPPTLPLPPPLFVDGWDGYAAERRTILASIAEGVRDLVVLTGDYHESFVGELASSPATYELDGNSVGVEFIPPAVTSPGLGETLELGGIGNRQTINAVFEANLALSNPWVLYHEGFSSGFGVVEFSAGRTQFDFWFLRDRHDPQSAASAAASWEVPRGRSKASPAAGPLPPRVRSSGQVAAQPRPVTEPLAVTGGAAALVPAAAAVAAALAARRFRDAR